MSRNDIESERLSGLGIEISEVGVWEVAGNEID